MIVKYGKVTNGYITKFIVDGTTYELAVKRKVDDMDAVVSRGGVVTLKDGTRFAFKRGGAGSSGGSGSSKLPPGTFWVPLLDDYNDQNYTGFFNYFSRQPIVLFKTRKSLNALNQDPYVETQDGQRAKYITFRHTSIGPLWRFETVTEAQWNLKLLTSKIRGASWKNIGTASYKGVKYNCVVNATVNDVLAQYSNIQLTSEEWEILKANPTFEIYFTVGDSRTDNNALRGRVKKFYISFEQIMNGPDSFIICNDYDLKGDGGIYTFWLNKNEFLNNRKIIIWGTHMGSFQNTYNALRGFQIVYT